MHELLDTLSNLEFSQMIRLILVYHRDKIEKILLYMAMQIQTPCQELMLQRVPFQSWCLHAKALTH